MIPKIIWQTYKTPQPPAISTDCIKSWLIKNPEFAWYYFDDTKCDQFIKDHFSQEFYEMYCALPLGIMRSDIWRIAIVYVYGGIYADLDTECIVPAKEWINDEDDLIVGIETHWGTLANYVFAAAPKHPAVLAALEFAVELYNSPGFMDKNSPTPVQDFGANAWSTGILKHLDIDMSHMAGRFEVDGHVYSSNRNAIKENIKFFHYHDHRFDPMPHEGTYVRHHTASVFWDDGHESWRDQEEQFKQQL